MKFSLSAIVLEPLSKIKPKNAVILCHGYGGDGKDISILAGYWRTYLPDTIFICPDAPEKCAAKLQLCLFNMRCGSALKQMRQYFL